MLDTSMLNGGERGIIPGSLPSALRAVLRTFKIAPGDFVEQGFSPNPLVLNILKNKPD